MNRQLNLAAASNNIKVQDGDEIDLRSRPQRLLRNKRPDDKVDLSDSILKQFERFQKKKDADLNYEVDSKIFSVESKMHLPPHNAS